MTWSVTSARPGRTSQSPSALRGTRLRNRRPNAYRSARGGASCRNEANAPLSAPVTTVCPRHVPSWPLMSRALQQSPSTDTRAERTPGQGDAARCIVPRACKEHLGGPPAGAADLEVAAVGSGGDPELLHDRVGDRHGGLLLVATRHSDSGHADSGRAA